MAYYFKVKIGFDKNDFISIDETELAMAIRAQITGKVAIFKNKGIGTIAGNNIMSILPDYGRELGYKSGYVLDSEDMRQIPKSRINEYRDLFLKESKRVGAIGGETKLLN